ncbi:unnamed protein product [Tenebrio molitor]|nr:unnamed protein product [Tenebrio molitor]
MRNAFYTTAKTVFSERGMHQTREVREGHGRGCRSHRAGEVTNWSLAAKNKMFWDWQRSEARLERP